MGPSGFGLNSGSSALEPLFGSPEWYQKYGLTPPDPAQAAAGQMPNGAARFNLDNGGLADSTGNGVTPLAATQFPGISSPGLEKLLQMHLGALNVGAMRPEQAQARTNALQNQLSAFQPMNRALESMYGPVGGVDLNRLGQNPMGPSMMQVGQPNQLMGLNRPPPFQPSGPGGGPPPNGPQPVSALLRLLMGAGGQ